MLLFCSFPAEQPRLLPAALKPKHPKWMGHLNVQKSPLYFMGEAAKQEAEACSTSVCVCVCGVSVCLLDTEV